MRRTGTGVRGRRFAALLATAGVAVGMASSAAYGVDSIRDQEWHLDAMHAPEMWQTSTGAGITIAVIDSGVKADAPDLAGQVLPGKNFNGGGDTSDIEGHGTSMAGIIAGSGKGLDGKGGYGLAPGAKILPLKTNDGGAKDVYVGATEELHQIDQAIIYAADQGVKIINISQGIGAQYLKPSDLKDLKDAVEHASSRGALVIASAGNSAKDGNPVEYPGGLAGVVTVGATDQTGTVTDESEHGPQVVLSAPGKDIYHVCIGPTGYCKTHGTSDATALVSASAALLWSVHPDWTNNQILRVLINTAGKGSDSAARSDFVGYGAVRPRVALSTPGDPGPADVSPIAAAGNPAPSGASTGTASSPAAVPSSGASNPAPATGLSKSGSGKLPLILGGAAVALLVLVGIVVLVVRRNRPGAPAGPGAVPGGYPAQGQPPYGGGGYPAQQQAFGQQPPAPGGFPPPPQGPMPPQGGNPYGQ